MSESNLEARRIVERSPCGRYIRYNQLLGRGAFKDVYRGFDQVDRVDVAWSQISIEDSDESALQSSEHLEKLSREATLLSSLNHENIMKLYSYWIDLENKNINMIFEFFGRGSLRQYLKKQKSGLDTVTIKHWAWQILHVISFLHGHNRPVVHRDLKCDNIFLTEDLEEVKVGDFGLATFLQDRQAKEVVGTPEFMAPEFYDEEYNELVDIYAFGMCLLELATCEYPYGECERPAQIYRKVMCGIKPAAIDKVEDLHIKEFIGKCLVPASERLSAAELLKDPFFSPESSKEIVCVPLQLDTNFDYVPQSVNMMLMPDSPFSVDIMSTVENHPYVDSPDPYVDFPMVEKVAINANADVTSEGEVGDCLIPEFIFGWESAFRTPPRRLNGFHLRNAAQNYNDVSLSCLKMETNSNSSKGSIISGISSLYASSSLSYGKQNKALRFADDYSCVQCKCIFNNNDDSERCNPSSSSCESVLNGSFTENLGSLFADSSNVCLMI